MASEIQLQTTADITVYGVLRNAAAQVWNGSAFVTYSSGSYASYAIALTEQGTSSGFYVGDFPAAAPSGAYSVVFSSRAGATPAESDPEITTLYYSWTISDDQTTTPAGTSYCAEGDVSARLSAWGVELRVDDNTTAIFDCIANASSDIDMRLLPVYDAAAIAASRWVHFACRAIAVYYVCLRRNNPIPPSVQNEYEKTIQELNDMASGTLTLPGAAKATSGIAVSNVRFDNTRYPAMRVERPRSTPKGRLAPRRVDIGADRAVR